MHAWEVGQDDLCDLWQAPETSLGSRARPCHLQWRIKDPLENIYTYYKTKKKNQTTQLKKGQKT